MSLSHLYAVFIRNIPVVSFGSLFWLLESSNSNIHHKTTFKGCVTC